MDRYEPRKANHSGNTTCLAFETKPTVLKFLNFTANFGGKIEEGGLAKSRNTCLNTN